MGIGGIYISRNRLFSKFNTLRIFISSIILVFALFASLISTGAGANLTLETGTLTKIIVDPLQKNELDGDYIEYIISDFKGNIWKLTVNFSYDENTDKTIIDTIKSYTTGGEYDIDGAGPFNTSDRIDIAGYFNDAGLTIPVKTIKNIKDYNNNKIAVLYYEIDLKIKPPQPPTITSGVDISPVNEQWEATWTTDVPTNTYIRYSTFSETNEFEESYPCCNTTHTVILKNMNKSNTTYYYTVLATDENGYFTRSEQNSFNTVMVPAGVLVRIEVEPDAIPVVSGKTQSFTARGSDRYNTSISITPEWDSSNTSVGKIEPTTGITVVFTANKTGETTITASYENIQGHATVTVTTGNLSRIEVIPANVSIASGEPYPFTATGFDVNDNPIYITPAWNSSNTTVGTINESTGVFSANQTGTTIIKAEYESFSDSTTATVTIGNLNRIEVTPDAVSVASGMNYTFNATGFDVNNNTVFIIPAWSSSNTSVGTINESTGVFSANQTGTTIINATNESINGSAIVTVVDMTPPASLTNLTNITFKPLYINWTWTPPQDADFNLVQVYIDGSGLPINVSNTNNYYNASFFKPNTTHTISTHTMDTSGNVNTTWVNSTANTSIAFTYVFNFTNTTGTMVNPDAAKNDSDGRNSTIFTESLIGNMPDLHNYTYVTSYIPTNGTIASFLNMQNSTDAGAFANLTEGQALTNRSNRTMNPAKTITTGTQSGSYTPSNLTSIDGTIDITIPGVS